MPDHGGNRTYDLWNTSPMLCQLSYAVLSVRVCDISEQNLVPSISMLSNIIMIFLSLRAGSLGEREPARIPMMIAYRSSIRMSHMSINNNQSAQTGNTLQYRKHKPINAELHLYYIILYCILIFR